MTGSTKKSDLPGTLLMKIARLIFDEPALSSVIAPALTDLQQEWRDAGANRGRQLLARWRGYWAVCVLLAVVPFTVSTSPISGRFERHVSERHGGTPLVLLIAVLFAGAWTMFLGWFVLGAVVGGILLALGLRSWHNRHPSALPDPLVGTRAEINLSSIPVAGNAGGLIFALGSVVIVMLGLPELQWFFMAAVIAGFLVAGGLVAWRTAHPSSSLPENSIATR